MKKWIYMAVLFCLSTQARAQNKMVDSLKNILRQSHLADTTRVLVICELANEMRNKVDTLPVLLETAFALSKKHTFAKGIARATWIKGVHQWAKKEYQNSAETQEQALKLATKAMDWYGVASAYTGLANAYTKLNKLELALEYYTKSIKLRQKYRDFLGLSAAYANMGVCYKMLGNIPKSLESYFTTLKILEEHGQNISLTYANACNNIALVYNSQKEFEKGLLYLKKSLSVREKMNDTRGIAFVYSNIGDTYKALGKNEDALATLQKAYRMAKEFGGKEVNTYNIANIVGIYLEMNELEKAEKLIAEGLQYAQELKMVDRISMMELLYADFFLKKQRFDEAYRYAKKGYEAVWAGKNAEIKEKAVARLAKTAEKAGRFEEALYAHQAYIALRDSVQNQENLRKTFSQEFTFKEQKMQAEQEKRNLQHKAEMERQRLMQYIYLGIASTTLMVIVLVGIGYRQKQRANQLLQQQKKVIEQKNESLNQANEELKQQQEEIIAQRDFIEEQNDVLSKHNLQITQSINTALAIQKAVLPFDSRVRTFLPDYFVLYKPRDIVSGDFYWIERVGEAVMIVVADCTGHGVPGAFMSLIAINLLERVVLQQKVLAPAKILRDLHALVRLALKQDEIDNQSGMDIAVVNLSLERKGEILFAGAKRPLFYIDAHQPDKVSTIAASRKSIGGIQNDAKDFDEHCLVLPVGSTFYMCSDGMADQNDVKRKRLKDEPILAALHASYPVSMEAQRLALDKLLEQHMEGTAQRDDVIFLGVKV